MNWARDEPLQDKNDADDPTILHSVDMEPMGFRGDVSGIGGFMNHEATFDGKHRPNPHAPYRSRSRFVMPAPDPAG
uniref:Uncharacterized protein n=1 Tax=Acrobeloides nanus TaxID=290746 RepID=A0A914CP37_9BILA